MTSSARHFSNPHAFGTLDLVRICPSIMIGRPTRKRAVESFVFRRSAFAAFSIKGSIRLLHLLVSINGPPQSIDPRIV